MVVTISSTILCSSRSMTREAKMEAGAKPARSRHCKEGATFQNHCKIKPERLPKLAGRGMKRGYPSQETYTETKSEMCRCNAARKFGTVRTGCGKAEPCGRGR